MVKTLVLGCGTSLRRDDGLGPWTVRELDRLPPDPGVTSLVCQGLTPELAEVLAEHERAIFVDAELDLRPGEIRLRRLESQAVTDSSSHHLNATDLLAFTEALYGKKPDAYLLSMGVADLGLGEGFSPRVAAALPVLLTELQAFLAGHSSLEAASP